MIKYEKAKSLLIESLLENFLQTEGDEIEALVTHWMQNMNRNIPFLTDSMFLHMESFLNKYIRKFSANLISESRSIQYGQNSLFNWDNIPYPPIEKPEFKFIDLFAGIGGFRIAFQDLGGKCVFSSEWDPYAKKTYELNFGEVPYGDIRKIDENSVPDHDVLCAGFPCQPFSLAGVSARNFLNKSHGFACETQGTLFFDIERIIRAKKPKIVFLENVKNIINHDGGKTFQIIRSTIESLGYSFSSRVIDSSSLVPQRRLRTYMVCLRDNDDKFKFPEIEGKPLALKSILENKVDDSYTISDKLWEGHQRRTKNNLKRGTGFTAYTADISKPSNTIVARYGKDGKECLIPQKDKNPRMLTPRECARLQGFEEKFIIGVAKTTAYRQFGNSVAIPVVKVIAERIVNLLKGEKNAI